MKKKSEVTFTDHPVIEGRMFVDGQIISRWRQTPIQEVQKELDGFLKKFSIKKEVERK